MDSRRYKIILYNNGRRVKVIKKYTLYGNAIKKYREILKNNIVYFPKQYLWDGRKTKYELVLTAPPQNKGKEYVRNELGALVKIQTTPNFVIKQINDYGVEDVFTNRIDKKKYDFKLLIKKLMKEEHLTHVVSVINNKVVIEHFEDEAMDVFVFKNRKISYDLAETLKEFNNLNGISNFIYFMRPTFETRVGIYNNLESRYGIKRKYMQKIVTH
jgi:hypothetical protein